jgi:hypothetical protein
MAEEEQEQDCPCKEKPSSGLLNFGINDFQNLIKNPNEGALNLTRNLAGRNGARLENLIRTATGPGTGLPGQSIPNPLATALPSLLRAQNQLQGLNGIVDAFAAESARLSTVEGLLSTVSSLNLFSEINCALGIEGLDIGLGLSVVNENGQFALNFAVVGNVDLEKALNQITDSDLGSLTADAVGKFQGAVDEAFAKLDEANAKLNELMDTVTAFQNEVADLISKYTNLNALAELINKADTDPCFKLGSTINGSLISPQFLNAVRGGTPTGFGSFR